MLASSLLAVATLIERNGERGAKDVGMFFLVSARSSAEEVGRAV